jgi:4-hydroxy-4-methyl-2-oxoglutarate aldolase
MGSPMSATAKSPTGHPPGGACDSGPIGAVDGEQDSPIARLKRLDTCSVSDALDLVGIEGVVDGLSMMWPSGRVGGRVITVRLLPVVSGAPAPLRHLGTNAIGQAGPGDVIVVDNQARTEVAGWGGLLSQGAVARGVEAVIVYGACRDVGESRQLGLPLFATNATPRTARGRTIEESTGDPIDLGGVTVRMGDLVLADESGVVVVPQELAPAVLDHAEAIASREGEMAEELKRGVASETVMGRKYENMLDQHGAGER